MTILQNIKSNPRKALWTALFAIALTGLVLMFLDCYLRSDIDITGRPGARRVEGWHERLIFPFYFTFISNVFGLIVSFLRTFKLDKNVKLLRRLEIFAAVNLVITLIVYWATLFPKTAPDTALSWASNMFIHLITPVITVIAFVFQTKGNKHTHQYKALCKESAWHLIFPLAWLAVATILYFALGAAVNYDTTKIPDHNSTKVGSGAIYFFLDYCVNAWWITLIYIVAIGGAYYGFTLLAMWLSNPKITK